MYCALCLSKLRILHFHELSTVSSSKGNFLSDLIYGYAHLPAISIPLVDIHYLGSTALSLSVFCLAVSLLLILLNRQRHIISVILCILSPVLLVLVQHVSIGSHAEQVETGSLKNKTLS